MKLRAIKFFLLLAAVLNTACQDDESGREPLMPSELSIEVQQQEENPAAIRINLSSRNTNFYKVWFGTAETEAPVITNDQTHSHTYPRSGTYTIRVQAHATELAFITESREVQIDLGDGGTNGRPDDVGYTTPEAYEGMRLVWRDEFEGNRLNTDHWTFETGTGSNGWGNEELQYYREENTAVRDGYLIITAKEESHQGRNYTSSRIKTQGKQEFQYGRIDIRAKMPQGQGLWPALWMLGSDFPVVGWPACGEIDIMEMIGGSNRERTVHGTIHWSQQGSHAHYGNSHTLSEGTLADKFHVFSIIWDEEKIVWYIDDIKFNEVDITPAELSEFHQEFFFIFNVAVGGRWPGSPNNSTVFPQQMMVDYVRVFQAGE